MILYDGIQLTCLYRHHEFFDDDRIGAIYTVVFSCFFFFTAQNYE